MVRGHGSSYRHVCRACVCVLPGERRFESSSLEYLDRISRQKYHGCPHLLNWRIRPVHSITWERGMEGGHATTAPPKRARAGEANTPLSEDWLISTSRFHQDPVQEGSSSAAARSSSTRRRAAASPRSTCADQHASAEIDWHSCHTTRAHECVATYEWLPTAMGRAACVATYDVATYLGEHAPRWRHLRSELVRRHRCPRRTAGALK